MPLGVVLPRTSADVVAVVAACARFRVPLTARGGGTSQAGQSIGPGVVLDTSKYLNRVLEVDAAGRWVRVEPGCVLHDLNRELQPLGLTFAPTSRRRIGPRSAAWSPTTPQRPLGHLRQDDRPRARPGGRAGGRERRPVRPLDEPGLEAKCSRGISKGLPSRGPSVGRGACREVERRFPKVLRRVGGYNLDAFPAGGRGRGGFNLAHLFVGSEGTLGIVVEARLRLVELPRAKAVLVVQFAELLDALAATPAILAHRPAAVELVDRYVLDSTRLNKDADRLRDFLVGDPGAILLVELYGDRPEELPPRLDALEADLRGRGFGDHLLRAIDPAAQARIWKLREMALGLSMAEKGDAKAISFVEDTAVAPEHLRDYIAEFLAIIARHGTRAGVYAHASVGCLHIRPVIDLKTEAGLRQFEALAAEVAELVLKYGGALSGEHGDGLARPFQETMYGPALYRAFRELKRTFDPRGLLNPGKIVDAPPLAANLRFGPGYVTPEVPTLFDFSSDGGLVRAAELCAGVGACRKKREGTMCPSYQATRDERDSTRGRANALRLALTGQAGLAGLTDPALHEVFDLCLECKACKAECPTNVDMARLKAEFLHRYYREHGLPWRNRVFGHAALLGRWGGLLAPVSNWAIRARRSPAERAAPGDRPPSAAARVRREVARRPILGPPGRGAHRSSWLEGPPVPRYVRQLLRAGRRRGGHRAAPSGRLRGLSGPAASAAAVVR
ncbi:MAG: FAD-binding and (Fe-S)-binding domain-containing protein [Singulisphaera sp.]